MVRTLPVAVLIVAAFLLTVPAAAPDLSWLDRMKEKLSAEPSILESAFDRLPAAAQDDPAADQAGAEDDSRKGDTYRLVMGILAVSGVAMMMTSSPLEVRLSGHDDRAFLHNMVGSVGFALTVIGFYRYLNPE